MPQDQYQIVKEDAADRAVELLCAAAGEEERTEVPEIAAEGREAG